MHDRTQFTAHLEIRVRNAIGDCPDQGQFGSALRDNYDLYHMLSKLMKDRAQMITMETPLRPSWRRHSRAVATTTIYHRPTARMTQIACMLRIIGVYSA